MKLLVAIPALNEEYSIGQVITEIHSELPKSAVLVINDGSSDKTSQIARSHGATVLDLPFNVGVGGALRSAFKYALENGYSHVLQIDADGQHIPSEAKNLINLSSGDSVIIGSRFEDGFKSYPVALPRYFAMKILAKILSLICKTKLTDVTSGFRIASGKAIDIFAKEYPRDYLGDTVESIIIAHRNGIEVKETFIQMQKRQSGNPSQNFFKSSWYLIRALIVIFLALFKKKK